MFHDPTDLSELISSRICHDLISPLGAISNGLELLSMTGVEESPELELIAQSIANANSKIRFFRVAFGQAPDGTSLARAEVLPILTDYFRGARVRVDWTPETELPRREVKRAFLAIQCLEAAMPYGGTVTVAKQGKDWEFLAEARKLRIEPDLWAYFDDNKPLGELSASDVQFGMLAAMSQAQKATVGTSVTETSIVMRLQTSD